MWASSYCSVAAADGPYRGRVVGWPRAPAGLSSRPQPPAVPTTRRPSPVLRPGPRRSTPSQTVRAGPRTPQSDAMAAYQTLDATTDLVFFRPAAMEDLDRIDELETAGYPADEAASREGIQFRLQKASDLFTVAVRSSSNEIIGFVNGTATSNEQLEAETMSMHDPEGKTVCIHSVCVAQEEQRKGIASRMLKAYIAWIQQSFPVATNVQLICKEDKMELYRRAGFQLVGPSKVVHGSDPWMDMRLDLPV